MVLKCPKNVIGRPDGSSPYYAPELDAAERQTLLSRARVIGDPITAVARYIGNQYATSLTDEIRAMGSEGKALASLADEVAQDTRNYLAKGEAIEQRMLNGVRKVRQELRSKVWDGNFGDTRFKLAVEDPGGDVYRGLSDQAKRVVDQYREMIQVYGAEAEALGMQIKGRGGQYVPFLTARDGARMLRSFDPDFLAAMESANPKADPSIDALLSVLAKRSSLTKREVQAALSTIYDPSTSKAAFEIGRLIPYIPTHVRRADGSVMQVLVSDPVDSLRRAVRSQAARLAYIKHFGQDTDISKIIVNDEAERVAGEFIGAATGEGARRSRVEQVRRLIRAMHEQDPAGNQAMRRKLIHDMQIHPRSAALVSKGLRAFSSLMQIHKSLLLTRSAVPNIMESPGTLPGLFGVKNTLAAVKMMIQGGPSLEGAKSELRRLGALGHRFTASGINADDLLHSLGKEFQGIAMTLTGAEQVNNFNDLWAGLAAWSMAEQIKSKNYTEFEGQLIRERLRQMDFAEDDINTLMAAKQTDATRRLLDRVVQQGTRWGTGSVRLHSERSALGNSKTFQALVAFDSFFQLNAGRVARVGRGLIEAAKSKDKARIRAAGITAIQYLTGKTLSGAATVLALALLKDGLAGFWDEADELTERPLAWFPEALATNAWGGFAEVGSRALEAGGEGGLRGAGGALVESMLPLSFIAGVNDAVTGSNSYSDLGALDRAELYLRRNTPILNTAIATQTAAMIGLGGRDEALDSASSAYWQWRREQGSWTTIRGRPADEEDAGFRRAMRQAAGALRRGESPARHLGDALGEAHQVLARELGSDDQQVRANAALRLSRSILARRFLSWHTPEELASLASRIGNRRLETLRAHDRLLDDWASAVAQSSRLRLDPDQSTQRLMANQPEPQDNFERMENEWVGLARLAETYRVLRARDRAQAAQFRREHAEELRRFERVNSQRGRIDSLLMRLDGMENGPRADAIRDRVERLASALYR